MDPITAFLTPEFLSMFGGSLMGFIFRSMAERRALEQQRFENTIKMITTKDQSSDAAIGRVNQDAGKVTRRIIVLAILFATMFAPFVLPFFNITTVVETKDHVISPFWGLFGEWDKTSFNPINGFLFTQENRQVLLAVIGFYFGNAAAGRKT